MSFRTKSNLWRSLPLWALRAIGCGAAALTAVVAPAPASAQAPEVEVIEDVAYAPPMPADGEGHLMDLYLPQGFGTPRPLVIWSSGSAWMSDTGKEGADAIAEQLNPFGYAVAGVSIRSSSQAKFPAQIQDAKAAVRFLRQHAGDYNLDPTRFGVSGNSSGGWFAAMVGTTGDVDALEGDFGAPLDISDRVQAVLDLYGPTDFLQMDANAPPASIITHDGPSSPESQLVGCPIQECPDKVRAANPVTYLTDDDPPFLIMHGQADSLVPHHQSQLLYEAMRDRCLDAEFFSLPGHNHEHAYLDNPALSPGSSLFAARDCGPELAISAPPATWDVVRRFFDRMLTAPLAPPAEVTGTDDGVDESGDCANRIDGSDGNDTLNGTDAEDGIRGGGGDDTLDGGAGDDCVSGQGGEDQIAGGEGADQLEGGRGKDALKGGSGDDVIRARRGARDRINCGPGDDKAFANPNRDLIAANCETVPTG